MSEGFHARPVHVLYQPFGSDVCNTLQARYFQVSFVKEKHNCICLTGDFLQRQHLDVAVATGAHNIAPAREEGMVVLGDVLGWAGCSLAAIKSQTRATWNTHFSMRRTVTHNVISIRTPIHASQATVFPSLRYACQDVAVRPAHAYSVTSTMLRFDTKE